MTLPQYSELWTAGPLTSATCPPIFIQFTGCEQPVKRFYWTENAIAWTHKCVDTQISTEWPNCMFIVCTVILLFLDLAVNINFCYIASVKTKRDWLIHGHVALDKCNVSLGQQVSSCCRVASLASKAPNFSILASFDTVWLLKIWFGFSLFSGFFLASFAKK